MTDSEQDVVRRYKRNFPPTHYMFKIEPFFGTPLKEYKSEDFEVGGHKWSLSLNPNAVKDEVDDVDRYLSLYLIIEDDIEQLPLGWEVNVSFKFFVFDQIRDNYLTIEDTNGEIKRFHALKTKWGIDQLLLVDSFKDVANGYIVEDSCVLGVEIFVADLAHKLECLKLTKSPSNNTLTWKIENFSSSVGTESSHSQEFIVENSKLKLSVVRTGCVPEKTYLSFYVHFVEDSIKQKCYAEFQLKIKSQSDVAYYTYNATPIKRWFTPRYGYGYPRFISLQDLNNPEKGFIVNDCVILEANILVIS